MAVRVRPMRGDESKTSPKPCAVAVEGGIIEASRVERKGGAYLRSQQSQQQSYKFDAAFGPQNSQREVYEATTRAHISALARCDLPALTVMAYGATGAGKTHTILGEGSFRSGGEASGSRQAGIIPRVVGDLFNQLTDGTLVRVSYLEVYNEKVYDLLADDESWGDSKKALRVCEDDKNGVVKVLGLTEMPVADANESLSALRKGNARRTTEATGANDVSSRSHAVFQLRIVCGCGTEARASTLSLIDLAGSERASATGNRGARLAEAAHINKSLLALANCINALTDDSAPKPKYRDSKLTLLLKTSLESPSVRLVVVACVSPDMASVDDTFNTLKNAQRAKELPSNTSITKVSDEPPSAQEAHQLTQRIFSAGDDSLTDRPPPKPERRRFSTAPKRGTTRRGSVAPPATKSNDPPELGELRRASTVAVANARAAALAAVETIASRGVSTKRNTDDCPPQQQFDEQSNSQSSDSTTQDVSSGDLVQSLKRELERLRARLHESDARAQRWQTAARDLREHADALAAACRACVESSDDVGSLRARWEHGGLCVDVEAARARWERTIIANDAADNQKVAPLADHNGQSTAVSCKREPPKAVNESIVATCKRTRSSPV